MKNKFSKKYKNVLIIKGTQGMAKLSLAVVSGSSAVRRSAQEFFVCASETTNTPVGGRLGSTPRARMLNRAGRQLTPLDSEAIASLNPRARRSGLLWSQLAVLVLAVMMPIITALVPSDIASRVPLAPEAASAATSNQLNFQGRLLTASGALVPDGVYNMQFDLYNVASGGSSLWTEDRLVTNTQGVSVQNGYYSVYLGQYDAFPAIDWSQDLYLGMTIRGTSSCVWGSCTPADSEMTPRFKLTAVPYAFRASNVASSSTNAASSNSDGVSITTGNALGATSNSGNITVDVGTATGTTGTISLGSTNASALTIGRTGVTTTLQGSVSLTGSGTALSVTNDATVGGALTVNGNTTIGNATSDTLTVEANATFNGSLVVSTGDQFTNAGSTVFTALAISDVSGGGNIGSAASTVDVATTFNVNQTTAGQTLTLPTPTSATSGRMAFVNNVGSASFSMYGSVIATGKSNAFIWNGTAWVTTVSLSGSVVNTIGTIDSQTKSSDGAVISSNAIYLQTADASFAGLVSTGTQTFAGAKTFNGLVTAAAGLTVSSGQNLTLSGVTSCVSLKTNGSGVVGCGANEFTYVVAASNSVNSATANYVGNGDTGGANDGDQVEINAAIAAADAAGGGTVLLLEGTYTIDDTILLENNVTLMGSGKETIILSAADGGVADNFNMIENSDFTGGNKNITLRDMTIDGNRTNISASTRYSIDFEKVGSGSSSSAVTGFIIDNVHVINTPDDGIFAYDSRNSRITNSVVQNTGSGVSINMDTSDRIQISGNRIVGGSGIGTRFSAVTNSSISNNVYDGVGASGDNAITLRDGSNDNIINGNTIQNTGGIAIEINGSTGSNANTISNNNISGSIDEAIYLTLAFSTNVTGNTLYDNEDTAGATDAQILVTGNADENQIVGNFIQDSSGNQSYAINLSGANVNNSYVADNYLLVTDGILNTGTNTSYGNQSDGSGNLRIQAQSGSTINLLSNTSVTGNLSTSGTITVGTLGTSDTSTYLCRNSSNIIAGCTVSPLSSSLTDNVTDAFDLQEGTNNYININTTNGSENISFGNAMTNPSYSFLGSGTLSVAGNTSLSGNLTVAASKYISLAGGNTASRPASPTEGMIYFDTTTKQLLTYANGKWQGDRTTATKIVAANNSSQALKDAADYVADGTADEVEINAALTAAAGGKVYLAEGTYVAAATILVPNNTTLAGAGRGTVVELADLDATENLIENTDTTTGTGVVIRDMRLDGRNDLNTAGTQYGIALNGMGSGTSGTLRPGATLTGLYVEDFRSRQAYLTGSSSNNTIANNTFQATGGVGVYFTSGSIYNTVENNRFGGFSTSLSVLSNSNTIINNRITGSSTDGIEISGNSNTITGNYVNGANNSISLNGGSNNTVTANTVESSAQYGVLVTGASFNTISANVINTPTTSGVLITSSSNSNIVSANRITNSGGSTANNAIDVSTDDNTLTSNSISDTSCTTTCYAITISSSGADRTYVADNILGGGTINDSGTNTRYASQLSPASILQSSSTAITSIANTILTGSIDPTASTSVTGVSTKFTTELQVGDKITVSAETRTVVTITSDTALAVDVAFSNNANDTSVDRIPAGLTVKTSDSSAHALYISDSSGATAAYLSTENAGSANNVLVVKGEGDFGNNGEVQVGYNGGASIRVGNNFYNDNNWTGGTGGFTYTFTPQQYTTGSASTFAGLTMTQNFAPTSGTNVYSGIASTPTINQTGTAAGITRGLYVNPTLTAFNDFRGIQVDATSSYATANNQQGAQITVTDTGAVASGTDTTLGASINVTRTGASGGTINNTGLNISLTGDTGGTSTNTGLNVSVTGADTNYAAIFQGGNVGIGDTSPAALLTVGASDAFQVDNSGNVTAAGTVTLGTLGTSDTSTYLCRNSSNIIAGCTVSPLSSSLTDNVTDAFDLQEGTNNYININTTNGSENISFGNATTNPSFTFLGSGTVTASGLLRVGTGGTNGTATGAGDLYVQDALEVDGGAVVTGPSGGSSTALIVNTGAATNVGLRLNGASGQSANLLEARGFGESYNSFEVQNDGETVIRPVTGGDGIALRVRSADGLNTPFYVDTSTGYTYTYGQIINGLVQHTGSTQFQVGGTNATFTSPQSASIAAKMVFDLYNPGSANQVIALGLPSGAATNSRGISLFDNRAAGDNQPVLSVFSPDETDVFGLSSDGSNAYGYLKATSGLGLGIKSGTTVAALFETSGNTTLNYDLAVNGDDITSDSNLTVNATGYVRIGDSGTPSVANGDDDLYVEGDLEAGGTLTIAGTGMSTVAGPTTFGSSGIYGIVTLQMQSADNFSSGLRVQKRGNSGDVNGAVASGGELGYHEFYGWNGSAYVRGAYAIARSTEAFTGIANGSEYAIATTPNGSTTAVERLTVEQNGNVVLNQDLAVNGGDITTASGDLTIAPAGGDTNITGNVDISGGVVSGASNEFSASATGIDYFGNSTSALRVGRQAGIPFFGVDASTQGTDFGTVYLTSSPADAGTTTKNSTELILQGSYYNGSTNYNNFTFQTITTGTTASDYKLSLFNTANTEVLSVSPAGNLTLAGDLAVNGDDITSDSNLTVNATGYVRIGDSGTPSVANGDDDLYVEGDLEVDGGITLGTDTVTDITGTGLVISSGALGIDVTTASGFFQNGGNAFTATSTLGNTGNYDLNVITNNSTRLSVKANGDLAVDTDTLFVDESANYVGIGTSTPDAKLQIQATTSGENGLHVVSGQSHDTGDVYGIVTDLTVSPGTNSGQGNFVGNAVSANIFPGATVDGDSVINYTSNGTYQSTGDIGLIVGYASNFGYYCDPSACGNVDNIFGFVSENPLDGPGVKPTITSNVGVAIEDRTRGTNQTNLLINASGIDYGAVPSGSFSIYNASTKDNVFAGNLRVGSTSAPTVALDVTGAGAFSGDVAVNGDDLTTTQTTFNLLNTTATTVNAFGGATTALNLGASTGTINLGSSSTTNTQTFNIANGQVTTGATAVNILSGAAGTTGTATLALGNSDRVTQIDIGNVAADAARTINLGTGNNTAAADTINIGTGTPSGSGTKVITIGSSANVASTTSILGGNGTAAIALTPQTTGTIVIGAAAGTGNITLGSSSGSQSVLIGNGAGASTVNIANATTAGATVNIAGGAAASATSVNIANGATAAATTVSILSGAGTASTATLNLGNNARVTQIDVGNVAAAAARTINVGTGNNTVGIDTINIGTGNTTVAGGKTINIGTGTPTGSGTNLITVGSTANASALTLQAGTAGVLVKPANGTTAFQVQNASSASLFTVDTTNNVLSLLGNNSGEPQTWLSESDTIPAHDNTHDAVIFNGYIYVAGGDNHSSVFSTVAYAKLNANGSTEAWSTTGTLSTAVTYTNSIEANGYLYVLGGATNVASTNVQSIVQYAKINSDGTLGAFTTTSSLPAGRKSGSVLTLNGYMYYIGGDSSSSATPANTKTVYYAKINADGTLGTWANVSNSNAGYAAGAGAYGQSAIAANGYIYVVGGNGTATSIYYARPGSNGDITSNFTLEATNGAPAAAGYVDAGLHYANGYMYIVGGANTSVSQSTVYYAPLNANGSVGTWLQQSTANDLPAGRSTFAAGQSNGYFYAIGGYNGGAALTTVYYTSLQRIKAGGNLDLGAYSPDGVTDPNGAGSLTAGNTLLVGTLTVQDAATFNDNVNINGNLGIGNGNIAFAAGAARTLTVGTRPDAGTGYNLTLQAGAAGSGNNNGGNLVLAAASGSGTGVKGLVVIDTATYSSATLQTSATSTGITQANVDSFGAVLLSASSTGVTFTLPDPTINTTGRVIYVTNAGANDFTLAANTVGTALSITLKPSSTATMYWNGSDWTAAGASSSTDLQAAYNNTAASAGNAEIVLSNTGTGGLTVRNGTTTSLITGGLLEVQTSIGSNLFSVNNNATEYASNGGAETSGTSTCTSGFPASTWTTAPAGGTCSRSTATVATGTASAQVVTTTTNHGLANTLSATLTSNLQYSVSFTIKSSVNMSSLEVVYSRDGTNTSTTACASAQTVTQTIWTRINCTFTAPSSGITSANAIFIRQTDATGRTLNVDNLSVTVKASVNHAVDGSVDSALGTNWVAVGGSVTRTTSTIYDTSGAVSVAVSTTANRGVYNNLAAGIIPTQSTTGVQYRAAFYIKANTGTVTLNSTTPSVYYSPDSNTTKRPCNDLNVTSITTGDGWKLVSCLFTTDNTAPSGARFYITNTGTTDFYVDALTITLNTNTANNVQIGGGSFGGPATLFTLDRSNGTPIADNNDAYLGSMYYDTSTGRIQCYEADGWGACGAAPDNYVNLNPEYAGAVLNGTGVGTMTADFCANQSGVLQVNYVASTDPCFTSGDVKNYYKWTSPQATQQTYSIYITYQLPATFNGFSSDDTVQLAARVDNTTNASVTYQMFAKTTAGSLAQCWDGVTSETNIITGGGGSANTWYSYGVNGNEATSCGLNSTYANGFVIFKINMKANSNASAYVSTLSFTTTGR